jgi:ribonucleotide monophosphatase NagD (HAD superfamily)
MIRRIPGILSDIDGVLQRGLSPFSFTSDYINFWTKKLNLPFALLTNGGGQTENTRIKILNNRFKTKLRPD